MSEKCPNIIQRWAIRTIVNQEPSNWNWASRKFIEKMIDREGVKDTLLGIAEVVQPRIGVNPKPINQNMFLELASHNDNDGSIRVIPGREKPNTYEVVLETGDANTPTTTKLRFEDGRMREKEVTTIQGETTTRTRTTTNYDKVGIDQILQDKYVNSVRSSTDIWLKRDLANGPGLVRFHTDFDTAGSWDSEEKSNYYFTNKLLKRGLFTLEEVYGPITPEFEGKYNIYKTSGLKIRIV